MNNIPFSGVVNVLKPPGMSSHGVVNALRKIFDTKKVGHTGTLDPGAAGVLPICIGKATRLSEYLVEKQKVYYAHIVFGTSTNTYDNYGTVTETSDKIVDIEEITKATQQFVGDITQLIPAFSAKKVNGEKLYDLARNGNEIIDLTKNIHINAIEVLCMLSPNIFLLKIDCGVGTYIRSICHELGKSIGVPAHMGALVRTKSGDFEIEKAYTIDELKLRKEADCLNNTVISMENALLNYPAIHVNSEYEIYVKNGRKIPIDMAVIDKDTLNKNVYKCYCNGVFYGVASLEEDIIRIDKLLNINVG